MPSLPPGQKYRPHLLDIPQELRYMIYKLLLTTASTYHSCEDDPLCQSSYYSLQPQVLCVCKDIFHEARGILYDQNMFILVKIDLKNWPRCYGVEAEGSFSPSYLPIISRKQPPAEFVPALTVSLNTPAFMDGKGQSTLLLAKESYPILVERICFLTVKHKATRSISFWDYRVVGSMHLSATPAHPAFKLQQVLLEPLSIWVRYMKTVTIDGDVDEHYSAMLAYLLCEPNFEWKGVIDEGKKHLEKGHAADDAGMTRQASFLYRQGFVFTGLAVVHANRQDPSVTPPSGDVYKLTWELTSAMKKTLLKMHFYNIAFTLGLDDRVDGRRSVRLGYGDVGKLRCFIINALARLIVEGEGDFHYWIQRILGERPERESIELLKRELRQILEYCGEGYSGSWKEVDVRRYPLGRDQVFCPDQEAESPEPWTMLAHADIFKLARMAP
ncbi:MAG: hypothetical protein Q9164_004314 [Protoblastenia rupestris]